MTAMELVAETLTEDAAGWWPHYGHDKGYIAVSRTNDRIRRYCCDNCGGHHWGMLYTVRGYDFAVEHDFEYSKPSGEPYRCRSGHVLHGGPEHCMGECSTCQRARLEREIL